MGNKMEITDCGKSATCGVNGKTVIVSKYNFKCPCLNCIDCNDEKSQCPWKYVLQTEPRTDDDIKKIVCANCIQINQEHKR